MDIRYVMLLLIALIYSGLFGQNNPNLTLTDTLMKDGITWRFDKEVQAGSFVNGDYYVVGPVNVISISPEPSGGRNGSVVNLPVNPGISGFDDRVSDNRYREEMIVSLPVELEPGDALISSISLDSIGQCEPWLREGNETPSSPVRSYSILTCCETAFAEDAFRPSYCDREQKVYYRNDLQTELLLELPIVENAPDISVWAEHFRRPWLDVCFYGFDAATEYQAVYGREVARTVGIGTLLLNSNYSIDEKENLLVHIIQYGIDLWGIVRAGYSGWQAHGGHGSGRKWPIIFAGTLLGDTEMASPSVTYPELRFGEDMQTMYAECWTGAEVIYAGHQGVIGGVTVSSKDGWGPYEQLHPSQWDDAMQIGENYRRCCTSIAWVGQALAARLMNAKEYWHHEAFFDYVDRWMTEDDSAAVATIEEEKGWDYSANWQRQGQCWDAFVENMWTAYRERPVESQKKQQPVGKTKKNRLDLKYLSNINNELYDFLGRKISTKSRSNLSKGVYLLEHAGHGRRSVIFKTR